MLLDARLKKNELCPTGVKPGRLGCKVGSSTFLPALISIAG